MVPILSCSFLVAHVWLLPSCTAVLLTYIIPGWFSFLCNCFLSVCVYPVGNPVLETLAHTWLYSNIDFVSFSSALSYKLHLSFCLECFRVIDYWMNRVHPQAKTWFNPSSARDFRARKLKLQHPLEIRAMDVFPGCRRAVPLGTPLGLEYLFLLRHRVKPQFLSRQSLVDFWGC